MLTKKMEEIENDFHVGIIKNQYLKNSIVFEKAKKLEPYRELEKIVADGLMEGKSVIDCLKEHPFIIHYAFMLHVILKNEKPLTILPIMQSIKQEHISIFYFFLKQILIKNTSKIKNCPIKNLIDAILNNYKEEVP